jgi:hypothetical protein
MNGTKIINVISKNELTVLIIAYISIRFLFLLYPFWGLEYEDSFIYNDTARFLSYSYDHSSMPFKCQSCINGSFKECNEYGSYGGHFLTFPIFLNLINWLIGYHPYNVFSFNFIISVLIIISIMILNTEKLNVSLKTVLALFIITPFSSIFHTSGLAETISSLFVLVSFLSIYLLNEKDFDTKSKYFYLSIVTIILSFLTKRENLILIVFIILIPLLRKLYGRVALNRNYFLFLLILLFLGLFFSWLIGLFNIEANESGDIGKRTFALSYFMLNIKALLLAIISLDYWGITGVLLLFCLLIYYKNKNRNEFGTYCLLLFSLYIAIYSTHYRSYYQVLYNNYDAFETLRYSNNYFPIVVLFIASNIFFLKNFNRLLLYPLVLLFLANSINSRIYLNAQEYKSRIEPVFETLKIAQKYDIIITDIPIIFHCFVSESQIILDTYRVDESMIRNIRLNNLGRKIYFLTPRGQHQFKDLRFKFNFELDNYSKINSFREYDLYEI